MRRWMLTLGMMALWCWSLAPASAQQPPQTEPRIALVIGNANYGKGPLPTALNDAGLVAEALRSIGFEIVEGADLGQPDMVRTFREFLAKLEAAGPEALAVVYFSGHGLAFEGDNFLVASDARLERESDVAMEAVRLSDLMRALAETPARARVMIVDASRPLPFKPRGQGLAPGLAAVDAPDEMMVAYASAPGTVAPDGQGPYGAYATAIAEMVRAPGLDLDAVFTRIRTRTHQLTEGRQTPWQVSALGEAIELVPAEAATVANVPPPPPPRAVRPMRELSPEEAYALAIEQDTLAGYVGFVEAYPRHAYSARVWAIIRARREALAWMRARQMDTPPSYWTYLRRYPNGIYAFDAERRLRRLSAPFAPPPQGFAMVEFDDVPLPLAGEPMDYVTVYEPGPPPPRMLIEPPPAFFSRLPPPPPRAPRPDRGPSILPLLAVPLAALPLLAPAPRRERRDIRPGDRRPGERRPGSVQPRGASPATAPAAVSPSSVTPQQRGPRPGAVAPPPSVTPGAVPSRTVPPQAGRPGAIQPQPQRPGAIPQPGPRVPGQPAAPAPTAAPAQPAAPAANVPAGRRFDQQRSLGSRPPAVNDRRPATGQPPLGVERRPPPAGAPRPPAVNRVPPPARPAVAPRPPSSSPPPSQFERRPAGAPPPGMRPGPAMQAPPAARPAPPAIRPAPPMARPAPPPPAARPAPPPVRPAPPAAARPAPPPPAARPAPPPPRPAAAPPSRAPGCPPGKSMRNVGGRPTCA